MSDKIDIGNDIDNSSASSHPCSDEEVGSEKEEEKLLQLDSHGVDSNIEHHAI
jgi:hypothetical protein